MTNNKVMVEIIEEEHPSNELVSRLEQKIRELEKQIFDMREWDKLLLSVNPTLESNMDKQSATNQAIFQNKPPPTQPSSIHMPPNNTYFPNYHFPPQHDTYASRPPHLTTRP